MFKCGLKVVDPCGQGFAHVGGMGIAVGGFGALAPERLDDLAGLGLRALAAATLATLLTGCVAGLFYQFVFLPLAIGVSFPAALAVGILVGVLGQIGDLAESAFKRSAGVKDSGGFFPGHGGVLDRLDSLYWALPVTGLMLAAYGVL